MVACFNWQLIKISLCYLKKMWSIAELNRYYLKSVYQMVDKPSYNHYENAYSFPLDFCFEV